MARYQKRRCEQNAGQVVHLDVSGVRGTPRIGWCTETPTELIFQGGTPKEQMDYDQTPETLCNTAGSQRNNIGRRRLSVLEWQ